ncbi:hydantoinase/oxoprolinase family protein [Puniceibacterium sp. IMCC21224]|uniref:hydantoinase/oxoprolinase family protein n=1 Tax=Puniceibacterium sp. IMCC21224 TaxID=1618204 RepID=UPI00064E0EB0|nr:hydantoinase/oxoprolinase family protein [Puniceibacterium sp. IMCC21224]KMK64872.1 N-methylhydantoinase A/acetone carboxylase, beta subunit [Puniceibacterium sp. IMCC21224]
MTDATPGFRIGVDIGGTFTDVVMLDPRSGRLANEKVLTTPDDPAEGVLNGVQRILANEQAAPGDVQSIIHGTTLVANALIERKGVRTALVTTQGFRDVLEIGRELRYSIYDLFIDMPEPLVPRVLRFEVDERMRNDGTVLQSPDPDAIRALAAQLRDAKVEAVAIVFLHSFRNDENERVVKEILAQELPGITICTSFEVMPQIGEYERTSTAVANAFVQPIFRNYVQRLVQELGRLKLPQDLYLMLADGGTVRHETAVQFPIRLVQSGPAGGAQAAAVFGRLAQEDNLLCFDMGGTTAKACLIQNGEPLRTDSFEVARVFRFAKGSGLPLQVPVIDMIEIGAGGGSIAQVDKLGLVRVGPESASSKPGPACYGLGGRQPTVTDADLVLGYLDAASFLGGDMALDKAAAEDAIRQTLAEPLGLSVVEAAWGIYETVNESMAQAATIHALESGRKVQDFTVLAIGGAGPVHAANLARRLGVRRVICPLGAGVASAFGFLASPISFEFARAAIEPLTGLDLARIDTMVAELEREGIDLVTSAGIAATDAQTAVSVLMRYSGQGYQVDVAIPRDVIIAGDTAAIQKLFEQRYLTLFGRTEAMAAEIMSWRVVVAGPKPVLEPQAALRPGTARIGQRPVYFGEAGDFIDTPVYDRYCLPPNQRIPGPAVFEERESTIVMPPSARARADQHGNLIIDLDL